MYQTSSVSLPSLLNLTTQCHISKEFLSLILTRQCHVSVQLVKGQQHIYKHNQLTNLSNLQLKGIPHVTHIALLRIIEIIKLTFPKCAEDDVRHLKVIRLLSLLGLLELTIIIKVIKLISIIRIIKVVRIIIIRIMGYQIYQVDRVPQRCGTQRRAGQQVCRRSRKRAERDVRALRTNPETTGNYDYYRFRAKIIRRTAGRSASATQTSIMSW